MKKIMTILFAVVMCILVSTLVWAARNFETAEGPFGYWFYDDEYPPVFQIDYRGSDMNGAALYGYADYGSGVKGESINNTGVYGIGSAEGAEGVKGESTNGCGVRAISTNGYGIEAEGLNKDGIHSKGKFFGIYSKGGFAGLFSEGEFIGIAGSVPSNEQTFPFTVGVSGFAEDKENSYGVLSFGNAHVKGNLTVSGAIPEYENIALNKEKNLNGVTAGASSEHGPIGTNTYTKDKINDGLYGRWDTGEWATDGEMKGATNNINTFKNGKNAWIELYFPGVDRGAQVIDYPEINIIKIFPRPNRYDQIYDAWLQIKRADDSITDIHLGQFSNGGAPRELHLTEAEGKEVMVIKVTITLTSDDTKNIGLAEIEAYYDPNIWYGQKKFDYTM